MKIVFVMRHLIYGGAEYQIRMIIRQCVLAGHDVFVLVQKNNSFSIDLYSKEICSLRIPTSHFFSIGLTEKSLLLDIIKYYRAIFKLYLRLKPDLVFVYDKYGILTIPFMRLLGIKVVYSERNSGESTVSHLLYRLFFFPCNLISCNSEYAKKILENGLKRKVIKINNYIEYVWEKPIYRQSLIDNKKVQILVAARISKIKNQKIVLEALRFITFSADIYFAGEVDDMSYMNELREMATIPIRGVSINFLGYVKDKESLYKKMDLVILPSFSEGTPNVILECFVRKIPVIASNIPQNEILFSEKNLLFNPYNAEDLAKVINYIMNLTSDNLNELLSTNQEYIIKNFGMNSGPQKYVELFSTLKEKNE